MIDVRSDPNRLTEHLFRACIVRCQRTAGDRQRLLVVAEWFGDAEVEQPGSLCGIDQHIGRFDIPMNDQVRMGVGHCIHHLEQQVQPLFQAELVVADVSVDGLAIDQLHDDVRRAILRRTRIVKPSDVRMAEPCLNLSFLKKPGDWESGTDQLQRNRAIQLPVSLIRPVDGAHAALSEHCFQAIAFDDLADPGIHCRADGLRQLDATSGFEAFVFTFHDTPPRPDVTCSWKLVQIPH